MTHAAALARLPVWMARIMRECPGHQWWGAVSAAAACPPGGITLSAGYWQVSHDAGGADVLRVLAAFFPGRTITLCDAETGRAECGVVPA